MNVHDNRLEDLVCCLAEDRHFVIKPLFLNCGHYVCKNCMSDGDSIIKCKLCGKVNKLNVKNAIETNGFKNNLSSNNGRIIELFENEFQKSIKMLKSNLFYQDLSSRANSSICFFCYFCHL